MWHSRPDKHYCSFNIIHSNVPTEFIVIVLVFHYALDTVTINTKSLFDAFMPQKTAENIAFPVHRSL